MSILVIAELREGDVRHATYPAVTAARQLCDVLKTDYDLLVLGAGAKAGADKLKDFGAKNVLWSEAPAVAAYTAEGHGAAAAAVMKEKGYTAALAAATTTGKDLMPRLAGLLGAVMVSDVVCFDAGPAYIRPMYAGKCFGEMVFSSFPQMASLRPNVFPIIENAKSGTVVKFDPALDPGQLKTKVLEVQKDASGKVDLTEANIVVSGGRGMKGPEGYAILEELAAALGATVGASRAAVDAGWRPQPDQVGQTGKIVSPNLYIACGISGAIQHLAGMSSSKFIVAINKDAEAPIFTKADYGVVDDLFKVIPEFTKECKKLLA